jgi:hypothetical protein
MWLGLFAAGASVPIKRGEILELTGNTNTEFVPIDSDYNMATSGDLAIAACDIVSGDLAGYYPIYIPRQSDVWEYDLAAAAALAAGTALYFSSSEALTTTAGSNIIAYSAGIEHYPRQGFGHIGQPTAGTTLLTISKVRCTFRAAVTYLSRFQKA